ncbi:MAG: helix-turn-helix transcriptional regulator [Anaerolineae bacterium]
MDDQASRIAKLKTLTPRQREVLDLVCQGLTYKQVAEALFIEETTVLYHIGNIYTKLGIEKLPKTQRQRELGLFCSALATLAASTPSEPEDEDEDEPAPPRPPTYALRAAKEDDKPLATQAGAPLGPSEPPVIYIPQRGGSSLPPPPRSLGRRILPWIAVALMIFISAILAAGLMYLFMSRTAAAVQVIVTATPLPATETPLASATPVPSLTATASPTPTATATPTNTPTVTITPTPTVTSTPTATRTVTPTPTPLSTTEPKAVLKEGDTWVGHSLALKADHFSVTDRHVKVDFVLKNITDKKLLVPATSVDNFWTELDVWRAAGKETHLLPWSEGQMCWSIQKQEDIPQQWLGPGESIKKTYSFAEFEGSGACTNPGYIPDKARQYFIVVKNIADDIDYATWTGTIDRP